MINKTAIFTMGISGSGKSFWINKLYNKKDYIILDSDKIKINNPSYNPDRPDLLHKWSKEILDRQFKKVIKGNKNFILDGTGTNTDKFLYRITQARANNFKIYLIYVKVNLKTALYRNRNRGRFVPEYIIKDKYKLINYSFKLIKPYTDSYKIINGNEVIK